MDRIPQMDLKGQVQQRHALLVEGVRVKIPQMDSRQLLCFGGKGIFIPV